MGEPAAALLPPDRCYRSRSITSDVTWIVEQKLAMNSTSVEKGANSQRFYGCAYNENETNVRKADGEIDEMYAKDVAAK